jgi:hypothetical protein
MLRCFCVIPVAVLRRPRGWSYQIPVVISRGREQPGRGVYDDPAAGRRCTSTRSANHHIMLLFYLLTYFAVVQHDDLKAVGPLVIIHHHVITKDHSSLNLVFTPLLIIVIHHIAR